MIYDITIYGERGKSKVFGCSYLMNEDDLREMSATSLHGKIKKIVIENIKW